MYVGLHIAHVAGPYMYKDECQSSLLQSLHYKSLMNKGDVMFLSLYFLIQLLTTYM